jgi:hypothetical protein
MLFLLVMVVFQQLTVKPFSEPSDFLCKRALFISNCRQELRNYQNHQTFFVKEHFSFLNCRQELRNYAERRKQVLLQWFMWLLDLCLLCLQFIIFFNSCTAPYHNILEPSTGVTFFNSGFKSETHRVISFYSTSHSRWKEVSFTKLNLKIVRIQHGCGSWMLLDALLHCWEGSVEKGLLARAWRMLCSLSCVNVYRASPESLVVRKNTFNTFQYL